MLFSPNTQYNPLSLFNFSKGSLCCAAALSTTGFFFFHRDLEKNNMRSILPYQYVLFSKVCSLILIKRFFFPPHRFNMVFHPCSYAPGFPHQDVECLFSERFSDCRAADTKATINKLKVSPLTGMVLYCLVWHLLSYYIPWPITRTLHYRPLKHSSSKMDTALSLTSKYYIKCFFATQQVTRMKEGRSILHRRCETFKEMLSNIDNLQRAWHCTPFMTWLKLYVSHATQLPYFTHATYAASCYLHIWNSRSDNKMWPELRCHTFLPPLCILALTLSPAKPAY